MGAFLLFYLLNPSFAQKNQYTKVISHLTFIVQSHFDTLLSYVLSVTFFGAVVLKVMDQKTLAKRR